MSWQRTVVSRPAIGLIIPTITEGASCKPPRSNRAINLRITSSELEPVTLDPEHPAANRASLATVAREWTRIGVTGFGGPPAHIALLRELTVSRKRWMDARAFEDANAACGLLPGPASTQLAILCAYRVAGPAGAIVGGLGFVVPAVALILPLSALFLAHTPPLWVRGAGAGAGAAVAAVAVQAARGLLAPSFERVHGNRSRQARWLAYLTVGTVAAALIGPYLVLALLACGLLELLTQRRPPTGVGTLASIAPASLAPASIARAVSYVSDRAANSSVMRSASIAATAPNSAIGRPCTRRCAENAVISSVSRPAAPRQRAATISRSNLNHS